MKQERALMDAAIKMHPNMYAHIKIKPLLSISETRETSYQQHKDQQRLSILWFSFVPRDMILNPLDNVYCRLRYSLTTY